VRLDTDLADADAAEEAVVRQDHAFLVLVVLVSIVPRVLEQPRCQRALEEEPHVLRCHDIRECLRVVGDVAGSELCPEELAHAVGVIVGLLPARAAHNGDQQKDDEEE
jgi:hypothetical protein